MGLHKQHAMTTLLQSYEFGLTSPLMCSWAGLPAVENLAARQLVAQRSGHINALFDRLKAHSSRPNVL